ncbi:dihydrodipicolinate synthase family protein [Paraburkholderia sp. JHI869]|uniref:dihydrodipicolinate synthase family protein n=1 Tax=Paraburkholderia sp. JHI869 TaxID=3112959 RepID=UPI00317C1041
MSNPKLRIEAVGINGLWPILPTPAKPNASSWRERDTVDLDETARVVDALIEAGVDGLLSLGTYGETHSLLWEEKKAFVGCVLETIRGRVPFFAGTTALNTREVIEQTRAMHDMGVSGSMLGVPMWCKNDIDTALQFFRDVTEACPDTALAIYANSEAFKFEFSRPFWAQIGKIPQVVACKYLGIGMLAVDLELAPNMRFLPNEQDYYAAARIDPDRITAFWSSGALCGPLPQLALRDRVAKAKTTHDWIAAKEIADKLRECDIGLFPKGEFSEFSKFNVPLEKGRMNAAGYVNAGPCRPPYYVIPKEYLDGAERSGRAHAALNSELKKSRLA